MHTPKESQAQHSHFVSSKRAAQRVGVTSPKPCDSLVTEMEAESMSLRHTLMPLPLPEQVSKLKCNGEDLAVTTTPQQAVLL